MILETEIEVEGGLVDAVIEYTYTAGEAAITNRAPGDCYEGTPAEIDVKSVRLIDDDLSIDLTFFLMGNVQVMSQIEGRVWSSLE